MINPGAEEPNTLSQIVLFCPVGQRGPELS